MPPFITLDGIDGVGKSTQIESLVAYLNKNGHEVMTVRDPGSTEIGGRLRALLLDSDLEIHRRTEAMLFMASRCEMIETTIRPALESGKIVISDRFLLSTVVYQSTLSDPNAIANVTPEMLWQMGDLANNSLKPDLTLLLDMPASQAVKRMDGPADRMESRGVEYMERVRTAFQQQLPESGPHTAVINADQPVEAVTSDLLSCVKKTLSL